MDYLMILINRELVVVNATIRANTEICRMLIRRLGKNQMRFI